MTVLLPRKLDQTLSMLGPEVSVARAGELWTARVPGSPWMTSVSLHQIDQRVRAALGMPARGGWVNYRISTGSPTFDDLVRDARELCRVAEVAGTLAQEQRLLTLTQRRNHNLTYRDAAVLLGVSYQRAQQLGQELLV